MRYITSLTREKYESNILPQVYGKKYSPLESVTIGSSMILDNSGVELVELQGETLAIQPQTASWVFLNSAERKFFQKLSGKKFEWLINNWPNDSLDSPQKFVVLLFRRGLLTINGHTSIDPTIFHDSHNTEETHLVELLLTEKCNLACGYCLAGTNPSMPIMSDEIAYKAVDLAYKMNEAKSLTF